MKIELDLAFKLQGDTIFIASLKAQRNVQRKAQRKAKRNAQ